MAGSARRRITNSGTRLPIKDPAPIRFSASTLSDENYSTSTWFGTIRGSTAIGSLGWSLEAFQESVYYEQGRDLELDRVRGFLIYQIDPQFRLRGSVGRESNNFTTVDNEASSTYGYGLDWAPTERTNLSTFREKRFFGTGYAYSLTHRTPLASLSITDTKTLTTTADSQMSAGAGIAQDLFSTALTTQFPDPVQREQEARRLLAQSGTSPDLGQSGSFATNRVTVEHRRGIAVALLRVRDTVAFAAYRTDREAIGEGSGSADDFNLSNNITETSFNANWSHRLTGFSSLNLGADLLRSSGDNDLQSDDWTLRLLFSTQLAPRTSGSIGLRYRDFNSNSQSDFQETAAFASINYQF